MSIVNGVLYMIILGSGLPWGMVTYRHIYTFRFTDVQGAICLLLKVLYGEEEEELMANSPIGSTVRTIWDDKNVEISSSSSSLLGPGRPSAGRA